MTRAAPSMPTPRQIRAAWEAVKALHPDARIARVGPEGVEFVYPDASASGDDRWKGKPFGDTP